MSTTSLIQLRDSIRSCTSCDLHKGAKAPVPWSGPTPANYLFIGMAPGIQEDREGRPFCGSSGNTLRHWLHQTGFPQDIAFANAVSCFPGRVQGGDAKPTPAQLSACRPNLTAQIDIIKPKFIFLVGGTAVEAFRPDLTLSYLHGRPMFYDGHPLTHTRRLVVWTIYHPAAAIRNKKYERLILEDLHRFWTWRRSDEPWPEDCYICGKEVHLYDGWGVAYCELHSMRQASLFPR